MAPSGHFLLAGFSDGTLRIFDMTRRFGQEKLNDAYTPSRNKSSMMVASNHFQKYGAVACQIHARGVHTHLLMHVDMSPDGQYCFAGVQRGSTELHAVYMGDLEAACTSSAPKKNLLDYVEVHVHSDAKLKGLGACSRVVSKNGLSRPKYLLLTGKAIKNIHIWSFEPPHQGKPAVWQQLYDSPTNGNSISLLSFCITESSEKLLAVSKSDNQKLRLWDLSSEQEEQTKPRPKRPPYKDVKNSESALGVAGGFCVCGGEMMYNQMSIVRLDQPDNLYNHTELALPAVEGADSALAFDDAPSRSNRRRRPQRGDLKQVTNVASVPRDASHVLLELDNVSDWLALRWILQKTYILT
jgi:WD40 repeat protein